MHTIVSVFDNEYFEEKFGLSKKNRKAMWVNKKPHFKEDEDQRYQNVDEGFFIFGGVDQKGIVRNDLWHIEPHYSENEKFVNTQNSEYMSKPTLVVTLTLIDDFKGKPPCPRIQHSATVFKDWNKHHLIVIYGGRNDGLYSKTQNVALNDICIFNVNLREW